jgi:hypothetical protein
MKYWGIIAGNLHDAGWSWSYCRAVTPNDWRWIVDAHKDDGKRYIVQSDQPLSAFLELEATLLRADFSLDKFRRFAQNIVVKPN